MMNISIIAFTQKGAEKAQYLKRILKEHACELYGKPAGKGLLPVSESLSQWSKIQFQKKEAIIFIGATGIAVRAIADAVKDKFQDPAVLVMDEMGQFVIPLLSGHVGGANDLAACIADRTGATPVITTATDLSGLFAIDAFAKRNHLKIDAERRKSYKEISAAILAGEQIGIWIKPDISYNGEIPGELLQLEEQDWQLCFEKQPSCKYVIAITDEELPEREWLVPLTPACYVLGVGCKKNMPVSKMQKAFDAFMKQNQISRASIRALASIDLKRWEPAMLSLAGKLEIPFYVYSAEALNMLKGNFSASDFVKKTTGVDNVCERAALAGLLEKQEKGGLYIRKTSFDGITFALAGTVTDRRIDFE